VQISWSGLTIGLDVGGVDGTLAAGLDNEPHRFPLLGNDQDLLKIEDDVRDILDHAVDALELVLHALDLDRADGGALDGAQEHAAEGIADGVTVAGLEGLGDELGVSRAGAFLNLGEFVGQFELSEAFGHGGRQV